MSSALNVALPILGKEFGMDAVTLGWVATAYTLAIAVFLVPFGRAADIHGRRRVYTYGLVSFTLVTALAALAPSGNLLIVLRVLQGVAGAAMFATSAAILSSAYPPERARAGAGHQRGGGLHRAGDRSVCRRHPDAEPRLAQRVLGRARCGGWWRWSPRSG